LWWDSFITHGRERPGEKAEMHTAHKNAHRDGGQLCQWTSLVQAGVEQSFMLNPISTANIEEPHLNLKA